MRRTLSLILFLFVIAGFLGCSRRTKSLPSNLLGVWTTDSPTYMDRYLRLDKEFIAFGIGPGKAPTIQRITSISVHRKGNRAVYTIRGTDVDGEHEIVFLHDIAEPNALRISNQRNVIWKKQVVASSQ